VRNGVLIRLFDIAVPGARKYFLVYPPRLADSPKLAPFRKWLFDEVAAERRDQPSQSKRQSPSRRPASAKATRPARRQP
jgi:hypothetical protein